jgi:hypothetical protein
VLSTSAVLAEILDEFRPLGTPDPPLVDSVRVAERITELMPRLTEDTSLEQRVAVFVTRFASFDALRRKHNVAASDVQMSTSAALGMWFVLRELVIAVVSGPFALWGRVNHWLPLRIAHSLALKMSRNPDEPAMNTIVAGLVLVLTFYVAQISLVASWRGWGVAVLYAISLPLSATWDFRYADRVRRGLSRVRTYLRFRRDPALHRQLLEDLAWVRSEAIALDSVLDGTPARDTAVV